MAARKTQNFQTLSNPMHGRQSLLITKPHLVESYPIKIQSTADVVLNSWVDITCCNKQDSCVQPYHWNTNCQHHFPGYLHENLAATFLQSLYCFMMLSLH